jgi:hypothetical protein
MFAQKYEMMIAAQIAEYHTKMGRRPQFLYLGEQAAEKLFGPDLAGINFSRHGAQPRATFSGLEVLVVSDDNHINVG